MKFNKQEIITFAIVGGCLAAAIYFINQAAQGINQGIESVGDGLSQGLSDVGSGVGTAAEATGVGAVVLGVIWALGNFVIPGL